MIPPRRQVIGTSVHSQKLFNPRRYTDHLPAERHTPRKSVAHRGSISASLGIRTPALPRFRANNSPRQREDLNRESPCANVGLERTHVDPANPGSMAVVTTKADPTPIGSAFFFGPPEAR